MARLLTPKQVARAIGVSESTLKRWCDSGRIPAIRTAGGHRRLRQEDVLQLVREGKIPFENPDALGLPPASGMGSWTLSRAAAEVTRALIAGEYERVQQTIFDLFLCGHRVAVICDSVLAQSMAEIGVRWRSGEIDVYQERRAVGLVSRVLYFVQQLLPDPVPEAPIAMGGVASNDVYTLPTMMVELTLQEEGWRATSLGGPLPFSSLTAALVEHQPRLFWLSVSDVEDEEAFLAEYARLFEACPPSTALVVGGRALDDEMRRKMRFTTCCDDLCHLTDFVRALHPMPTTGIEAAQEIDSA